MQGALACVLSARTGGGVAVRLITRPVHAHGACGMCARTVVELLAFFGTTST